MHCQRTEPELSKTFIVNMTSVQLLEQGDADGVVRELWLSREHAVSSVVIAEHGNARGVIQFSVVRVSFSHVSFVTAIIYFELLLHFTVQLTCCS